MPELPEVEIAARSLAAQVLGRRIVSIARLDWEPMVETPDPASLRRLLPGRTILAAGRRAKWLLLTLDAGWTLALHLRMSGNIVVCGPGGEPGGHTHLVLELDDGRRICFEDQRKFGRVRLLDAVGLCALDAGHGPEPLDDRFRPADLARALAGRRGSLKQVLLDQARIAGLGNIYVNEALWLARLSPLRPAGSLRDDEIARLYAAIRSVLTQAIANSGSTLRNYRNGYGQPGVNQEHFQVYDRQGQPCPRCGTLIERLVIGQRSTYVCPACQPTESS